MTEKRKIALFVSAIGYGGAEKVVSLLLQELTKYFDVTLILMYNEIKLPIHKDAKVIILSNLDETFKTSVTDKFKDYLKFIFKYKQVLKEENIDVALSFLVRQNIMNGIAKLSNPSLKTIISERCFPSIMYKNGKFTNILTKLLIPYFYNKNDKLFSNSTYINQDLIEHYKLKIDTSVIYNPIKTTITKPQITSYTSNNDFKVITVGRLIPVKNQESIIKAISKLKKSHLEIYGDGFLHDSLVLLTKELQVTNRVHFNGNVNQIKTHIIKGHCFVLSSLTEGFPNVVLEAMSVGLPVICTNCMSGPLELLNDNKNVSIPRGGFIKAAYGILVNVNDEIGLANAITYLKENPEMRQKYSNLSFERAKNYDVVRIGLQVKKLIDSI
ncbi:glycosyltransferase [Bizionia sp. KMM 8389]